MSNKQAVNIVWFKRDLRVEDHLPLLKACEQNTAVLPLYILEPALWREPDLSYRHYLFLHEALQSLNKSLTELGQPLIIRTGKASSVFKTLSETFDIHIIYSHQETWNDWTYQRDLFLKSWLKKQGIVWQEYQQNGVIRCLKSRDGWAKHWYQVMSADTIPKPRNLLPLTIESNRLPTPDELGLHPDGIGAERQCGGRDKAWQLLDDFLNDRGEHYTYEMSSPLTAYNSCSRLSPHIAFGSLSIREIYKALDDAKNALKSKPTNARGKWPNAYRSFSARLRWHCHFIQKLEDEPQIEFNNLHPAYDGLRETNFNEVFFEKWCEGNTGFPLIDACMKALIKTGWINFRMRAMLMSFASYHLWLHWRRPALHLAKLFTDYEPGIHYAQTQMQSGTTGINTLRIYNPIKQSFDQDPKGIFIKRWLPELRTVPTEGIHTPWDFQAESNGYPSPIVDETTARKQAASQLYGVRKSLTHRTTADGIVKKHASRRKPSTKKSKKPKKDTQLKLDL